MYLMRNRTIYQSSGQVYSVVHSPLPQEVRLIHTTQDFKGRAGGQNENHSSACMRLSLGTGQSSLCWHKAGRQLNSSVHVQRGLPSQTLSASQRADTRQSLQSWHDSWQVAYCYYYYRTLACKHDPEQEASMSRNNWLPSQQGFKSARRTVSVTGKQRQGFPKTNGKYLWRGRCPENTNTNVKCLECAETVPVEEKIECDQLKKW